MTCALAKNQDQKGSSKNGVQTERLTRDFITILAIVVGTYIHRYTHISRTTRVGRYQKGKTNLDFTEARDSEW